MSETIELEFQQPLSVELEFEAVIPGPGTQSTYTWNQGLALATWTIPHNLNRFPSVSVVDTLGNKVEPDVKWVDANIIQVIHGSAYAGKAYLN